MAANNALSYMRRKTWRYVRNVGKSIGYVAVEELKPHSSAITQLYKDARELSSNVRASAKANKAARIRNQTKTNTLAGSANIQKRQGSAFTKNLLSDLKSGKWYNQGRMDKASQDLFDFGTDADNYTGVSFDFGDDDFGDALFNDGQGENAAPSTGGRRSTVNKAFNQIGMASSAVAAEASIRSAEFIANSNNMAAKAIYDSMNYNFGQVMLGLSSIDTNIQVVQATVNDTLNTHALNSAKFYIDSSKYQQESLELLKKISTAVDAINANTAPASHGSNRRGAKDYTINSLLSGGRGGLLDFKSLKANIKSGIKDEFIPNLLLMLGLGGDLGGTGAGLASNPIGLITTQLLHMYGIDPLRGIKRGVGNVNNTIKNFFGRTITRARGADFKKIFNQDNALLGFLTPFFNSFKDAVLPKSNYTKIDTGRYNKGRVDWDGIARKSLVEVIPTQLGKILAAITGENEMRYDFEHGRWVDTHKHLEDFRKNREREKMAMGGDFMGYANALISTSHKSGKMSDREAARMNSMLKDFNQGVYETAGTSSEMEYLILIDPKRRIDSSVMSIARKYGIGSRTELLNLRKLAASMRQTSTGRNALNSYGINMTIGKDNMGSNNRYKESLNDPFINMMVDGSYNFGNAAVAKTKQSGYGSRKNWDKNKQSGLQSIMYATDKYNHDIFFYLQGIFQYTKHVSDNLPLLISGSKGKGRQKISGVKINGIRDVEPIKEETIEPDYDGPDRPYPTNDMFRTSKDDIAAVSAQFDNTMSPELKQHAIDRQWAMQQGIHEYRINNDEDYKKLEEDFEKYIKRGGSTGNGSGKIRGLINRIPKVGRRITSGYDNFIDILEAIGGSRQDLYKALGINKLSSKNQQRLSNARQGISNARNYIANSNVVQGTFTPEIIESIAGGYNGQAAKGRKVTKTGIVAVSEGELIIPSEFNPFYHGVTNKAQQIRNEQRAVKQYFGNYAPGGTVTSRPESLSVKNLWMHFVNQYLAKGMDYDKASKKAYTEAKKVIHSWEDKNNSGKRGPQGTGQTIGFDINQISGAIGGIKNTAMNGLNTIGSGLVNMFGPRDEKAAEGEKKKISELISGAFEDAGMAKSSMVTGAVLGGGVSLLTGAIVGPLAGAAIGAATGLIARSNKVQEALFGKDVVEEVTLEDGTKKTVHTEKKGLLPKKIANFMKNQLPSMARGTGAGVLAGAALGSPILGAIVGSSIGFVKSSDKAKELLFGKDENGEHKEGLIPKKVQDVIKKAIPNTAAGAALGLLAGPFGLAGNVIMGSALGFVTSTDKFKKWMYGDSKKFGEGGFTKYLDEKLLSPIKDTFTNLGKQMKEDFKSLTKGLLKTIKDRFIKKLGRKVTRGLMRTKIGQKLASVPGSLARKATWIAGAPFRSMSKHLNRRALRRGSSIYSSKLGRDLTIQEQMDLADEMGDVNQNQNMRAFYDMYLNNTDEANNAILDELQGHFTDQDQYRNDMIDAEQDYRKQLKKINNTALNTKGASDKEIKELVKIQKTAEEVFRNTQNPNRVIAYLEGQKGKVNSNAKLQLISSLTEVYSSGAGKNISDIRDLQTQKDEDFKLKLESLGIDNLTEAELDRIRENIETDRKVKKELQNKTEQEKKEKNTEEQPNNIADINNTTSEIKDIAKYSQANITKIANLIGNIAIKLGAATKDEVKNIASKAESVITGKDKGLIDIEHGRETKEAEQFREENHRAVALFHSNDTDENTFSGFARGGFTRKGLAAVSKGELILPRSFWGGFADGTPSVDNPDVDSLGEDNVVRGQHGNIEENKGSKAVYESNKKKASFFGAIGSIPTGFAAMNRTLQEIKGALTTGYKDGNEKKPGLFDMLKDSFFGGAASKIKGIIATAIQYAAPVLAGALAGKLAIAIAKGKLDKFGEKLGFGQASHYGNTYVDADGDQVTQDENGQYVKEDGTPATGTIKAVNSSTNESMGDKFKYNFVRGTLTGTGTVAGAMIKGAIKSTKMGTKLLKNVGKGAKWIGSKIGKMSVGRGVNVKDAFKAERAAGKTAQEAMAAVNKSSIVLKLRESLLKFATKIKNVPLIGKFAGYVDDICKELLEFAEKKTLGTAAKAVGSVLKSAAVVVQWALVVADLVTGWQDATKILGIKKATGLQKFGCALGRALLRAIPIIGSFLPEKPLIQFIFKHLPGGEKLMQAQNELQEEVDDYNEQNGTNLSVDEYQTQILGQSNIIDKAGNTIKSGFANVKNFFGKNKAAGATADASGTETAYAGSFANGGVVSFGSGATSGISNLGESALSGIGSKVANITTKIKEDVDKGDVKAIIKDAGKIGLGVAAGSMLPALIGPAMVNALINKVTGSTNVEKSGSGSSKLSKAFNMMDKLFTYAREGDTKGIDSLKIDFDSGMLTGIFNIVKAVAKIAAVVTNPLKWLGNTLLGALGVGGEGSGASASGSGFISQFDPRFRNKRLGGRSIADNGCGPASAVMAINQMNTMSGRGTSMESAINHAARYQTNGGTDAAYFADEFARNGYRAQYSTNRANILRNIASGRPTILMGRAGGSSKAFTPFGPNNHYVVANGIDSRGNIIISDPEQGGRSVYSPAILGQVKLGVSGGSSSFVQQQQALEQDKQEAEEEKARRKAEEEVKKAIKAKQQQLSRNKDITERNIIQNYGRIIGDDRRYSKSEAQTIQKFLENQKEWANERSDDIIAAKQQQLLRNKDITTRNNIQNYGRIIGVDLKNKKSESEIIQEYLTNQEQKKQDIINAKIAAKQQQLLRNKDIMTKNIYRSYGIVGNNLSNRKSESETVQDFLKNQKKWSNQRIEANKKKAAEIRDYRMAANDLEMKHLLYDNDTTGRYANIDSVNGGKRYSDLDINKYIMSKASNYSSGPNMGQIYKWSQNAKAKKENEEAYNKIANTAANNKYYNTSAPSNLNETIRKANSPASSNNTGPNMYQIGLMKEKSQNSFTALNETNKNSSIPTSVLNAMSNGGYNPTANLNNVTLPASTKNDSSTDSGMVGGTAAAAIATAYSSSTMGYASQNGGTSGSTTSSGAESTSKYGGMGILEAIGSIFGDALGKLFGKTLTGSTTSGGKGNLSASMASFTGKDPVDYMLSKMGQVTYDYGATNVDGGVADCSAMVQWAFQQSVGINIGRSSREQANCSKYFNVVADAGGRHQYFSADRIPKDLQRNDVLFFIKYNSHCDGDIGHVGIYIGDGQYIDHGSGTGPKIKTLNGSREQGLTKVCRLKDEILEKLMANSDNGYNAAAPTVYGKVGGLYPDTDVTRTIYKYFTNNGYTPAATAGIMGNMYRESGFDPSIIQRGSGHAAGLVQWESYKEKSKRWAALNNYATSIGKPWQDLNTQLNFINQEMQGGQYIGTNASVYKNASSYAIADNPAQAAYDFEKAFERGSVEAMDQRMSAAQAYYDAYAGGISEENTYGSDPKAQLAMSNSGMSASGSGVYNTMGRYIERNRRKSVPQENIKFVGSGSKPIIHKSSTHNFNAAGKPISTSPVVSLATGLANGRRNKNEDPLVQIVDKLCDIIGNLSDMHEDVSGIHTIMKDEHDATNNLNGKGSGTNAKKPLKNSSLPKRTMSNEQIAASLSELKAQVRQIVV